MRYLWMPRLMERIRAANPDQHNAAVMGDGFGQLTSMNPDPSPQSSGGPVSSFDSSSLTVTAGENKEMQVGGFNEYCWSEPLVSPGGYAHVGGSPDFDWWGSGDLNENLWSMEDNWLIQQQQQLL